MSTKDSNGSQQMCPATAALVSYLRTEADAADHRARRLRAQAEAMAQQTSMTQTDFDELNASFAAVVPPSSYSPLVLPGSLLDSSLSEMAPVDEFGVPKYKGKKRGRKPKKRKRQRKPDTPKRRHTGYTLFMQENYPAIKRANAENANGAGEELKSKDVISIVAKQWAELDGEVKAAWKERAKAINETDEVAKAGTVAGGGGGDNVASASASVRTEEEEEYEAGDAEEDGDDVEDEDEEPPPSLDAALDHSHHDHHSVPAEEVAAAAAAAGATAAAVAATFSV
uniref:HMG box domain-containing protein n=2 Tax=Pseudictyota dubia TaxID=2749911 RepID=A0A7R9VRC5_9STRA|mmetsp:Transcript_20135/g.37857  ORF Transcript_20135/g.37857 Transcript_20135/m.37857 type:complete len:283 (+) Transcript_20135:102-950(+)